MAISSLVVLACVCVLLHTGETGAAGWTKGAYWWEGHMGQNRGRAQWAERGSQAEEREEEEEWASQFLRHPCMRHA